MSADPQLCVDCPGQQSVLHLQLSVFSKMSVAAAASNIAEGGAWIRNEADLSDLDFWIPINRNYIDSFTDSMKEAEPEHLCNIFYLPHLAWPLPYLHLYTLFRKQETFLASSWEIIWLYSIWFEFDSNENFPFVRTHQVPASTLSGTYQMWVPLADGSDCPTVPNADGCCLMERVGLPMPTFYNLRSSPIISQICMCGFTIFTLLSEYKMDGKCYKQWWAFFARNCPMDCSLKSTLSSRCKQNYVIFLG